MLFYRESYTGKDIKRKQRILIKQLLGCKCIFPSGKAFWQVLLQLKQRKSTRCGGRRSRYLSSSAMGGLLCCSGGEGGHIACAGESCKKESSAWAKVPHSVPCVSGNKRFFQGSWWCNVNLCFEPIPRGEVGSSYSEVGGFT